MTGLTEDVMRSMTLREIAQRLADHSDDEVIREFARRVLSERYGD